ncbi:MAG: hypothetical protein JWR15_4059 [Prosthecobacter sp.]|nr:hypothetical protein [Prosthecobacter sp.]
MKHPTLLLLAILLCSCSTGITTTDPAHSYASTETYRHQDGTIQIAGNWDYVVYSRATDPPKIVVGGFEALVKGGKTHYAYCLTEMAYKPKPSAFSRSPDDMTGGVKASPYTRAALDQAAQGAGITVAVPKHHTSQFFSAAYLRGFLQKVDETVRNPAAVSATVPRDHL